MMTAQEALNYWVGEYQKEVAKRQALQADNDRLKGLLEDVVNELDLSEPTIAEHGPNGTPPAELVKLVLAEKDKKIAMLQNGMNALGGKP